MRWRHVSVYGAPFAAATADALSLAGLHTLGHVAALTRDQLGDRLPDLTSTQLDGVISVLDDARAGAAA